MQLDNSKFFLSLVRLGINHDTFCQPIQLTGGQSIFVDWEEIQTLAMQQGLYAIVIDGIEKLPEGLRPPKQMLLEWFGEVLQGYEYRYESYCRTIAEMAAFYNNHNLKMMVIKGYACSLNWPKPEHRPCGDIDIWQFGEYKKADALVAAKKGINIDTSHHHHTVFKWNDFTVENHYDFINVHHHRSHKKFEKILKRLGQDSSYTVDVLGEKVYLPSPNLHALFLLKHLMLHFASGEIRLRMLLDWAFFVEKHGKDINWVWLNETLDSYGLITIYGVLNAICISELGFKSTLFPNVQFSPDLKDRVFKEILCPEVPNNRQSHLIRRVIWKYKRWKANEWKHKLCYKESMWSAFWSGVWSHLLKPSSI